MLDTAMSAVQTPTRDSHEVRGRFVRDERGELYQIDGVERMRPFLVPLVSDSTLWAYFSSVGGVSAGRVSPECALFGYETDDRVHASDRVSGAVTAVLTPGAESWWFPFTRNGPRAVRRSIAKCGACERLVLTEREETLGVTACVEWSISDGHGLVRESSLTRGASRSRSC